MIYLLNRSTIQNSALVVFGRNPSFNLAKEGFMKSFFTFQAMGIYLGLGCGIGHVGIHWPRETVTSLRRAGGVRSMFWQPRVVNRSLRYHLQYVHSLDFLSPHRRLSKNCHLFHGGFVCLVVQPAKPCSRDHGGVIVHAMLGVVDHPPAQHIAQLHIVAWFLAG